ncbi:MAG: response regulator [Alphaproteobacteria bacterium]|nr:response regulator [Alphaproteobacteria bacterium]
MSKDDMRDINALIREAVDALSEGFAIVDADHRLIFANRISLRDFGKFHGAITRGQSWPDTMRASVAAQMPAGATGEVEKIAQQIMTRLDAGEAVDMVSESGRMARVIYQPMSDGNRVAISTDIEDLRQNERELKVAKRRAESASEAKSQFLANVSHEIRTPLNGMLGMAQVLASSTLDAAQREQVEAILDSGKTLIALLNDVLDLSKIEAGKLEIAPVESDLTHVLRRLYKLWAPVAEENGVELTLDLAASLPPRLKFDPVRVRQCITNLMSNAVKFTETGEVNVHVSVPRTGPNAGLVQVRVTDTGIGMDEASIERLFSPFTQADSSTSRRFGGTGRGLSITRRLAHLMGGDVTAKSRPGEGSTFVLTFSAEPAAAVAGPAATDTGTRSAARPTAPLSVLVVDDVPLNRKVARLFMEHQGWMVSEAQHGVEALAMLDERTFDVVLLDVHMPVMDGLETLKRIRASEASWSSVPVIALTANAMSGDRERYLKMGMDGYIAKPIDQRELFAEIGRVRAEFLRRAA